MNPFPLLESDKFQMSMSQSMQRNSPKKEVLWNIQQPGDPYDIRRYSKFNLGP